MAYFSAVIWFRFVGGGVGDGGVSCRRKYSHLIPGLGTKGDKGSGKRLGGKDVVCIEEEREQGCSSGVLDFPV